MTRSSLPSAAGFKALLCWAALPAAGAPAATSAQPSPALLAALAFPGWNESASGRLQTVTLAPGSGGANWSAGANRVLVEPKLVLRTGPAHLTLVAGLAPAGEDGRPAVSQLTPMALAAYQFERHGSGWRLAGHQGIVAWRGFAGAATLHAVTLSARRQAVGVEYGSCWQGYCGTWIALYELDGALLRREPAVEMALSGVNLDSAADCARRLHPLLDTPVRDTAPRAPGGGSDADGGHACYAIDSSWTIDAARDEPGDLSIRYRGAISRAGGTAAAAPVAIDQRQVLRYGRGKYRAVSGFNPVPPI